MKKKWDLQKKLQAADWAEIAHLGSESSLHGKGPEGTGSSKLRFDVEEQDDDGASLEAPQLPKDSYPMEAETRTWFAMEDGIRASQVIFDVEEQNDEISSGASDVSAASYSDSTCSRSTRAASTAPTEVAINAPNMETVLKTFIDLIFRQETMSKAMDVALQAKHGNHIIFKSRIRKAVKAFAAQLLVEQPNDQPICKVFQGRSHDISGLIIDEALGRASLDNKMSSRADREQDEEESQDDVSQGDDDEEMDGGVDDTLGESVDVMTFQEVVSSSQAFQGLLDDLHALVFPTFNSRLRELMDRERAKNGTSLAPDLAELFSELSYAQPSHIAVSSDPPSYIDWLQLDFEKWTRQQWKWSPFQQPLQPLQAGETRISWNCVCNVPPCPELMSKGGTRHATRLAGQQYRNS